MKGFIVVSEAGMYLTHREDDSKVFDRVFIGWTGVRKNALRYASKRQARLACGIFPQADATVERYRGSK